MEYISTRNAKKIFSFKDVFLSGLAPDGGLFIPKKIPTFSIKEIEKFREFSYNDLATELISKFCMNEFSKEEIKNLVLDSYKDFRVKDVVKIYKANKINLLELYHGPTLAFKDIAMQVIGNMYEKILKKNNLRVTIVVASSGDTGAAAIDAIKNRKNMKIFVLHPDKKISEVQRKFMTTVDSKNVFNIAIDGNFDDCQKLVKLMFLNQDFRNSINMSGVNSINWSRIVVQIVYYFFSYFKLATKGEKINFSVPTGNFGDVYSGYIAKKMGLPINKLIVATNQNDILKTVINTGIYKPKQVEHTISPSMDIQVASNFERLVFDICSSSSNRTSKLMNDLKNKNEFKLEKEELNKIKENFYSESVSDKETRSIIKKIYKDEKIFIDPHTAVGIGAVDKMSLTNHTIVLSTAHPSKFFGVVQEQINIKPELPEPLKGLLVKEEKYKVLPKNLENIQNYILERAQTKLE